VRSRPSPFKRSSLAASLTAPPHREEHVRYRIGERDPIPAPPLQRRERRGKTFESILSVDEITSAPLDGSEAGWNRAQSRSVSNLKTEASDGPSPTSRIRHGGRGDWRACRFKRLCNGKKRRDYEIRGHSTGAGRKAQIAIAQSRSRDAEQI